MARTQTVVTTLTCDMCGDDTEGVASFVVAVDEGTRLRSLPRLVDVCADHATQLRDLAAAAKTRGVTRHTEAQPQLSTHAIEPCPVCAVEYTRSNMVAHLVNKHGVKRIVQPTTCPDCAIKVDNANGMVLHRKAIHGYDSIAEHAALVAKPKRGKAR